MDSFSTLTKRERLIFTAGFFEGEGSIIIGSSVRKKNHFSLRVKIGNTYFNLLKSIKEDMGMGSINSQRPTKMSKFQSYSYIVTGHQALLFLKKLIPFLEGKKEEAILGIKFQEDKNKFSNSYHPGGCKPLPQRIILKRERMRLKMKSLKSVGRIRIG